jgi:hypothetical protein
MRMKKNDQLKSLLLEQLRKTPVIQIACDKTQVSRASFYRWRADDEVFAKAVDEALLDGHLLVNDLAETQLINAVKERNFAAIAYWLKHHHPSYKTKVEIEGTISTIQELSPEQKELVRKALSLANLTLESHDV